MKTLKTIVLIDDDKDDLFLTGKELHDYHPSLSIHSFTDILEGIKFLKSHKEIGAVFIDLYLKNKVKSINYLDEIKNFAPFLPIIILTFSDDPTDILEAYKHKIFKYMIKPLTSNKLDQLVMHL